MACRIPYIDNVKINDSLDLATKDDIKEQLAVVRQQHLDISKELVSAMFTSNTGEEPLFIKQNGYLIKNNISGTDRQRKQNELMKSLNDRLSKKGLDDVVYTVKTIYDKNLIGSVVVVNAFNTLTDAELQEIFANENVQLSNTDYKTLVSISQEDMDTMTNIANDWTVENKQHDELFKNWRKAYLEKLTIYVNSLDKSNLDTPDASIRRNNLKDIIKVLKDKDGVEAVMAVSKYIVEMSSHVHLINQKVSPRFKDSPYNIYHMLDEISDDKLTKQEREERTKEAAQIINNTTQYFHLFDPIFTFNEELKALGFVSNDLSSIDLDSDVVNEVKDILDLHLPSGQVNKILQLFKDKDFTKLYFVETITQELQLSDNDISSKMVSSIINDIYNVLDTYKKADINTILTEAVETVQTLKHDIKTLNYEIIIKSALPALKEKTKNADKKYQIDEDRLRTLLKMADGDEGIMKGYLDALIKSEDALLAYVATKVADSSYVALKQSTNDAVRLSNYADNIDIDALTKSELEYYYDSMSNNVLIGFPDEISQEIEIADIDWINEGKPTMTIETFGQVIKIKAYVKKGFLEEINNSLYDSTRKYFNIEQQKALSTLLDIVYDETTNKFDWVALKQYLDESNNSYLLHLKNSLYGRSGNVLNKNNFEANVDVLRKTMSTILFNKFQSENIDVLSEQKQEELLDKLGINDIKVETRELPKGFSELGIENRTTKQENNEDLRQSLLIDLNIVKKIINNSTYIYVKIDGFYKWVDIEIPNSLDSKYSVYYYRLNSNSKSPKQSKYNIEYNGFGQDVKIKWDTLKQDTVKFGYYKELYDMYQEGNLKAEGGALKYGLHPQVERVTQLTSVKDVAKSVWDDMFDFIKNALSLENKRNWINQLKGRIQNQSEEINTSSKVRQYVNGEQIRKTPFKFINYVEESKLETDLFRSVLAFKVASNTYNQLKMIEPEMQIIRRLVSGDSVLDIDERSAIKRNAKKGKVLGAYDDILKKNSPLINQKVIQFIDDSIYGESEFKKVITSKFLQTYFNTDISLNKISDNVSKYVSTVNLAWNVSAALVNTNIGTFSNLSMASGKKYFNFKDYLEAEKEYDKYLVSGGFIKDMMESNPAKKSPISQMSIQHDSIQGENLSDFGDIKRKGSLSTASSRLLMWTQGGAEHMIQTKLMIAMMMGYKVNGKSLWDLRIENKGEFISYQPEVTEDILIDFRRKLHAVNKDLHGQYAKLDKSMLSRHWYGKLAMVYKKYIWSSIRSRFGGERFDWEVGEETQGYMNAYLSGLFRELKNKDGDITLFSLTASGVNNLWLKPTLGALDAITGRNLGKIKYVDEFLYGGLSDKDKLATIRTTYEIAWFLMCGLLAGLAHGLAGDDDDKVTTKVLKGVEAMLLQTQSDIGVFLPFYNSFLGKSTSGTLVSFDKLWNLIKNPFAQMRAGDNIIKMMVQLFGDMTTLELERYQRNGIGYEKGDSKLLRDITKSFPIISAWYHVMEFLNPQEKLQFLQMMRKNS